MKGLQSRKLTGLGATLRSARVAKGISQEALAKELNLPVFMLEAIENESWSDLAKGAERPLTRQVAERVGVDLSDHTEAWNVLPGGEEREPPDPRQEKLERLVMATLSLGSLGLLAWLVVPGRDLKGSSAAIRADQRRVVGPWTVPATTQPYAVLGELFPEAPVNAEGVLVSLRSMDTCSARIQGDGIDQQRALQVSDPWILRVKGPFSITLDNAGVVSLEVAGQRIPHSQSVGESWTGRFGPTGQWIRPEEESPKGPPSAPETDPDAPLPEE